MPNWYDYNVTNPHLTDDGADIGTPDNTPVFFPDDTVILDSGYYIYGGQVVGNVPGAGADEYFIHLNKVYVSPGQYVPAGTPVGTTGGGVGDLLLFNGKVQPAPSQKAWGGASTGYHTEFGAFRDDSQGGDMSQFNLGWSNPSRQVDPTAEIARLHSTSGIGNAAKSKLGGDLGGSQSSAWGNLAGAEGSTALGWLGSAGGTALGSIGGLGDIGPAISALPGNLFHAATYGASRIGFFVVGLVLVLFGIFLIVVVPGVQRAQEGTETVLGAAPGVNAIGQLRRKKAPGGTTVNNTQNAVHVYPVQQQQMGAPTVTATSPKIAPGITHEERMARAGGRARGAMPHQGNVSTAGARAGAANPARGRVAPTSGPYVGTPAGRPKGPPPPRYT